MRAMTALGIVILLLLASPAVSQVPDDRLIVPGQRIGKWTLDMTIDALLQMNGPRNILPGIYPPSIPLDLMSRWFPDSANEIWWHYWANLGFSAATRGRDAQRVEYIFTFSGDFKTGTDIAPSMPRQAVENAYGRPSAAIRVASPERAWTLRLVYDEIGLAALIDRNDTIAMLFVFRPGTARTLWNF